MKEKKGKKKEKTAVAICPILLRKMCPVARALQWSYRDSWRPGCKNSCKGWGRQRETTPEKKKDP